MAEVQQEEQGSEKKHKKVRAKKSSTHIDMTPMVDLAFLLLTFFMLTTTFSKPKTMDITMPTKDKPLNENETKYPASQTMSVLLTENNKIIWYMGIDDPNAPPVTHLANFSLTDTASSIHYLILHRNAALYEKVKMVEDSAMKNLIANKEDTIKKHKALVKEVDKKGLFVLIKPDSKSKYKNLVDILDEMLICNVARYAIVDLSDSERDLIKNTK